MMKRLFAPGKDSWQTSLALLVLRVWLGGVLLLYHGIPKLTGFEKMKGEFPDPVGAGPVASLVLAIFAEVLCSLLLILGLITRFAALTLTILMVVAFAMVHSFAMTGAQSGELALIYLAGFVALLLAGPGRFSMDQRLFG